VVKYFGEAGKLVSIKSPVRVKDLEGKVGLAIKSLLGVEGSRRELFDNDKLLVIGLKKGECVAFMDSENCFWELSRSVKGRYALRRLKTDK
jgi:hypothetical protein